MDMHIDAGIYVLKQEVGGVLLEVGRLFVMPGSPVVEHWFLYKEVPTPASGAPQQYAAYTMPSGRFMQRLPITSELDDDVKLWFSYIAAAPATFDGDHYKRNLSTMGLTATYVEATCNDMGVTSAADTPLDANTQIDWGVFVLYSASDHMTGYLNVTKMRDEDGNEVDTDTKSLESWYLYKAFPEDDDKAEIYTAPGAGSGSYRIKYESGPKLTRDYSLQLIEVACVIR